MSKEELIKLTETLPYPFEDVKWIHDNFPEENQNEASILNVTNLIRSNGLGISYLQEIVKHVDSLKHLGL